MISWFPSPYPGESIYSLIARYHERSGNYLFCDSSEQLFGNRRQASSAIIPYRLGYLSEVTTPFGLSFDILLHEHTLYDYYLLFGSESNRRGVQEILQTNLSTSYDARMGLYERRGVPKFMRFCPCCREEERQWFGEGYWHNLHQTPGMICCEKHGCMLAESTVPMSAHRTNEYWTLEKMGICVLPHCKDKELETLCAISQDIAFVWEHRKQIRTLWEIAGESFADYFLTLAVENKLATDSFAIRRKQFLTAFQNQFSEEIMQLLELSFDDAKLPWPVAMCRHRKTPQAPMKYILLTRVLCQDFQHFLEWAGALKVFPKPKAAYAYAQVFEEERLLPYREKWETRLKNNPTATRNQLIQMETATHTWLKRHDTLWLEEHCPVPCKRGGNIAAIDWQQRDEQYVLKICKLNQKFAEESKKPRRITRTRFYRELGIVCGMKEQLPKSMELIDKYIESTEQWNKRRLQWAIEQMKRDGSPLIEWKIIRKAGICDQYRKTCEEILRDMHLRGTISGDAAGAK